MFSLTSADIDAIRLSAKVALAATVVSLPFGIAVAYVMSYCSFRGKTFVEVLLNLPLTLPPVVIGYLLLLLLGKKGWVGGLLDAAGIRIIFTWYAAVIASAAVGFPLLVRSIRIAMDSIDGRLIQASRTLGARWSDTLATVILPLSLRGIVAGSSLMFGRSLGEFGATIIVAGNIPGITQTIPLAVYDYVSAPGGEGAALALCLVSAGLSLLVLFFHEYLARRMARRD
ncbi:molybdate ABC transporter, inner membrane subunit [Geobacter metallireducens RCH3]|uniref:Molybdenum transport system permease n=1 Tax=Geobacter metallireducens (strain ATCC 53774 / DSM 7210 / GS-15) TaxID=269799 RepID=Q39YB8_GEOMG|nr:molybdate ABC transporter permease subunit [Geobacter metallireducens]ABB30756.1 molybdate ABC transporter, membrane protein [Geobacter metallireducens GS-15]EHP88167.1 molybdate ABC transporter, inner membrane subunit [Geobacter metallireducens RCH3]